MHRLKYPQASLLLCGLLLFPVMSRAATTATVGSYDDAVTNANQVDTDATGTLAAFTTAVSNAYNNNFGGVGTFDGPAFAATTTLAFTYGTAASKTITFTSSVAQNSTAVNVETGSVTPISGGSVLTRAGTAASDTTFTFTSITGGAPEEYLKSVGFTLLNRTGYGSGRTFTVTANYSNDTSSTVASSLGSVKGEDDTFWSFTAPDGASITSIAVDAANDSVGTSFAPVFDDFAFITVPEPGRAMLLLLGAAGMLVRRRRQA